eukprot:CAMPEP_0197531650 /NCGR_PEP_ID=MMETSP1318-20131121/36508_1 /TAXON_ID=552666 /ORGANISM="Partenskyella glossopodia, Strain RCC365" /LENGTH=39 /DNA_ID= /DNA_START= /DNA_END= /DNA_ORIENTATION=
MEDERFRVERAAYSVGNEIFGGLVAAFFDVFLDHTPDFV